MNLRTTTYFVGSHYQGQWNDEKYRLGSVVLLTAFHGLSVSGVLSFIGLTIFPNLLI